MTVPILQTLGQTSDALAALVADAAPMLCAIRTGPNRHVTGLSWRADLVITCDQPLPAQDSYTIVLPPGASLVAARPARRDPATNLASLEMDASAARPPIRGAGEPAVGALAMVLSADLDATPTARLALIRRVSATGPIGPTITLDLPTGGMESGFVLDARGGLLGMLIPGHGGDALVVPHATIARFADPLSMAGTAPAQLPVEGRPWLGLALQPIALPDLTRAVAGQKSGRLVVSLTPNGPADQAGVRLGDVLLAIDGKSVVGASGLRTLLGAEQIGMPVRVRLMRDGKLRSCSVVVALHPMVQV
jgi:S1-C subfamily serine protease